MPQVLNTPDAICLFMFAGNATVTLRSARTGQRFTYKVTAHKEKADWHWVALLTGPDNEGDFLPLGYFRGPDFCRNKKTAADAPSAVAMQFLADCLKKNQLHPQLEVYHEGRCGACNRKLTVPESILTGLGPECSDRLGVQRVKCEEVRVHPDERLMQAIEAQGDREQTVRDETNKHRARSLMELAHTLQRSASASA
jgi:hypothetical protein